MNDTYMLFREPRRENRAGAPSKPYAGDVLHLHPSVSADWGGGGLVTTVQDLGSFIDAFAHDKLFATLSTRIER